MRIILDRSVAVTTLHEMDTARAANIETSTRGLLMIASD